MKLPALPSWQNLPGASGSAQKAVLNLPVGALVYFGLLLKMGSSTGNRLFSYFVGELRLFLDTFMVWKLTAAQLEYIMGLNGNWFQSQSASGQPYYVHIPFARPFGRTIGDEDSTAIGTADLRSMRLECDFKASLAEAPDFSGHSRVLDNVVLPNGQLMPSGVIFHLDTAQINATAAGKITESTLPKDRRVFRHHFFTDKINSVRVIVDNNIIVDTITKAQVDALLRLNGCTPSASVFTLPYDLLSQRLQDHLNLAGAKDYRLEIDHASGVAPYEVVTEFLATKDGKLAA